MGVNWRVFRYDTYVIFTYICLHSDTLRQHREPLHVITVRYQTSKSDISELMHHHSRPHSHTSSPYGPGCTVCHVAAVDPSELSACCVLEPSSKWSGCSDLNHSLLVPCCRRSVALRSSEGSDLRADPLRHSLVWGRACVRTWTYTRISFRTAVVLIGTSNVNTARCYNLWPRASRCMTNSRSLLSAGRVTEKGSMFYNVCVFVSEGKKQRDKRQKEKELLKDEPKIEVWKGKKHMKTRGKNVFLISLHRSHI